MKAPLRSVLVMLAVLAMSAVLVACDDDGDDTPTPTTTAAPTRFAEDDDNPCGPDAEADAGSGETPAEGATPVTVTATDYSFAGMEAMAAAGNYAVSFTNQGAEAHELTILRVDDPQDRNILEIFQLEPDESDEILTEIGVAFACPGETTEPVGFEIEAGARYFAICFLPLGLTPDADVAEVFDAATHATEGEFYEWTAS